MTLQDGELENEKEVVNPDPTLQEEKDKDELSEEAMEEVSGGLTWQISPTSGSGQYSTPISWTPKS